MRDGKKKSASADNPLLTQYRETIKLMQEACAPLIVLAKGRRPPKLQVKPESSKSASSQSGSAITASKWFWESSQQALQSDSAITDRLALSGNNGDYPDYPSYPRYPS